MAERTACAELAGERSLRTGSPTSRPTQLPTAAAARWQLLAFLLVLLVAGCSGDSGGTPSSTGGSAAGSGQMVLGTTTSTQDTGLLDTLVPAFEKASDCTVKTVAVGSGEALQMGASGNADVLLVHSPAAEEQFMAQGHGVSRVAVMHNDFVLVGPPADPAHAKQAANAVEAFRDIAAAQAPFISRGDQSGTNAKERALWQQAGISPSGSWYLTTGQGMGETLTIASQKEAYTLSDRGTYLATQNLGLAIVTQGGTELQNPYHVIVVRHPGTNRACATAFSDWLVTPATQKLIGNFGVARFGQPLFFPAASK